MKKLFATVSLAAGLAAIMASSALAQNGTHRQSRDPYAASNPFAAYAAPYDNGRSYRQAQRPSARGSNNVYDIRGHYLGSHPGPFIRDPLARDPGFDDGRSIAYATYQKLRAARPGLLYPI